MKKGIIGIICFLSIFGCQNEENYNDKVQIWTEAIKKEIISDSEVVPSRIERDSLDGQLRRLKFWNGDILIKEFTFVGGDTAMSRLVSANQEFELFREHCPVVDRSWVGIKYKGKWTGVGEFRYCNGQLKERSISFNGSTIGLREEYKESGELINSIDFGEIEKVGEILNIEY